MAFQKTSQVSRISARAGTLLLAVSLCLAGCSGDDGGDGTDGGEGTSGSHAQKVQSDACPSREARLRCFQALDLSDAGYSATDTVLISLADWDQMESRRLPASAVASFEWCQEHLPDTAACE